MRRNKITQSDRVSGLMVQRLGLVQNKVIYMVQGPHKGWYRLLSLMEMPQRRKDLYIASQIKFLI